MHTSLKACVCSNYFSITGKKLWLQIEIPDILFRSNTDQLADLKHIRNFPQINIHSITRFGDFYPTPTGKDML